MRGFNRAGRLGIGGWAQKFGPPHGAKTAAGLVSCLLGGALARAQDASQIPETPASLSLNVASVEANIVGLAILSLMLFATIAAVLHVIGRRIWTRRVSALETELARTTAKLDRAALMLRSESQILISWDRPDAEPTVEGDFTLVANSPLSSRVLAFESWLERAQAIRSRAGDAVAPEARQILRHSRGQPARAPSRDRRPPGFRQRRHAHSRRLGRASSIG